MSIMREIAKEIGRPITTHSLLARISLFEELHAKETNTLRQGIEYIRIRTRTNTLYVDTEAIMLLWKYESVNLDSLPNRVVGVDDRARIKRIVADFDITEDLKLTMLERRGINPILGLRELLRQASGRF